MSWPECQLPTLVTNKQTSDSYCLVKLIPENCIVNLRMDHMYNLWLKRSHTSTEFKLSKKYIFESLNAAEVGNNNWILHRKMTLLSSLKTYILDYILHTYGSIT